LTEIKEPTAVEEHGDPMNFTGCYLLVIGAYPETGSYDEPRRAEIDRKRAIASISRAKIPAKDPVYGGSGPLLAEWHD